MGKESPRAIRKSHAILLEGIRRRPAESSAGRLDAFLQGADDPPLRALAQKGVDLGLLLGVHETVVHGFERTLARCLHHDLASDRPDLVRALAARFVEALSAEEVAAAQDRWAAFHDERPTLAGTLVYFAAAWPEGASLAPLREIYLEVWDREAGGRWRGESVVGASHLFATGDPAERRRLFAQDATSGRVLPLHCGVRISYAPELPQSARTFSVLELLGHAKPDPVHRISTPGEPAVQAPGPEAWTVAERLDEALILIARAVGGRGAPEAGTWLPPIPRGRDEGLDPVDETEPLHAWAVSVCNAERTPPWVAVDGAPWPPREPEKIIAAALLLRWRHGFRSIAASARRGRGRHFLPLLRRWLRDLVPHHPHERQRVRGRGGRFSFQPASTTDVRLAYHCTPWDPERVLTWIFAEWDRARDLVGGLAHAVGIGDARAFVRLVHALLPELGVREVGTFETQVTRAGYVPWSLCEFDRCVACNLPVGSALARWRVLVAAKLGEHGPRQPWEAAEGVGRALPGQAIECGHASIRHLLRSIAAEDSRA